MARETTTPPREAVRQRVFGAVTQADAIALAKAKSVVDERTGCWLWQGASGKDGYAAVHRRERGVKVKYVLTRLILGLPVGDARCAMHACDNKRCVNPEHLSIGTIQQNCYDAMTRKLHPYAAKTHCIRGHDLSEASYRVNPRNGYRRRYCMKCHHERLDAKGRSGRYGTETHCRAGHPRVRGTRCVACRQASERRRYASAGVTP